MLVSNMQLKVVKLDYGTNHFKLQGLFHNSPASKFQDVLVPHSL